MVEIFRDKNTVKVGYYKSILEQAGILCLVRNETIAMTEIPIPVFFPALCVMREEDVEEALNLLRKHEEEVEVRRNEADVICAHCGAENPGNFDVCWSCGELIAEV